ncbi:hypothetical protein GGI04_006240, partial [Coemansia thaxteri]
MAKRLRTRLRQARVTVERDLGHSLSAIVLLPAVGGPAPCGAQLPLAPQPPILGVRAHSYSPGDFVPPAAVPLDSENEAAHAILTLATPPAARAPALSRSPCQHLGARGAGRRLVFSRCPSERPPKRPRSDDAEAAAIAQAPPFYRPLNLSQIASLPQRALAKPRLKRYAS